MVQLLSRLTPGDLAAVLIVPALAIVVGVAALAAQLIRAVQHYREREIAATVVADMLDRGIPPQEIVPVLKAMGLEFPENPRSGGRARSLQEKHATQVTG